MAHFSISDVAGKAFYPYERLSRGAAGLAGAIGDPQFSVWLEDWQVTQTGKDTYTLSASAGAQSIDLLLTDTTGPIPEGPGGLSAKGPDIGNASYYYSQPRLNSSGTVTVGGQAFTVSGETWMDHEFSTSALGSDLVGWDWFSIQLDQGTSLMLFRLRKPDGSIDSFSSATLISAGGEPVYLGSKDFDVQAEGNWKSPHSGATYPSGWRIRIPGEQIELDVEPLLADQELNLSFTYWEGAVKISGTFAGQVVNGYGYTELTGYDRSMQGQF